MGGKRNDTVAKALAAIGQEIARLGQPDPSCDLRTAQLHSPHTDFLSKLREDDDPPSRACPVNLAIIRSLRDVIDTKHAVCGRLNAHVIDLIIVAFYWLLRPSEYCYTGTPDARTQAFEFRHVYFDIGGIVHNAPNAPLNDDRFPDLCSATLEFV